MWKNEGWAALEAAVAVAQEKIVAQLERLADQEHALALRDVLCGVADRELRVVIFGEFNTGKSTLINALLGRRALVAKARPTTGQVTRVIRGHPERVVVTFDDKRTEQCDLASVETFTLLDVHSKARDDIRCINVFVDVPALPEDVILIDTPGLADCPEQTHRATREAATADLVLILLDATHLLGLLERRLASDWLACDLEKPVVPVLNFMNNVEPAERKEIRKLMTEWSCQLPRTPFSGRYFEVNALAALRNALGIEAAGLANDDFQQLAKELHGLGGVRANNLRLKSRCSHLGAVLRSADTKNREALKLLQKDEEAVRREREIQLHQLLAVHERIKNSVKIERAHCVLLAEGKLRSGLQWLKERIQGNPGPDLQHGVSNWYRKAADRTLGKIDNAVNERLERITEGLDLSAKPITLRELADIKHRTKMRVEHASNGVAQAGGGIAGAIAGAAFGSAVFPVVGTIAGAILGSFLGASAGDALFKEPDYVTGAIQAVETDWVDVKILVKELLPAEVEARLNNAAKHIRRQISALNNSSVENSEIKMRTALQVEIERTLMSLENVSRLLKHDVGQGNTGSRQGPSNPIPAPETNHKTKQSGQPTSTRRAR